MFPAYAEQAKHLEEVTTSIKPDWLENSSFKADISLINQVSSETLNKSPGESSSTNIGVHKPKKKKEKHRKRKEKANKDTPEPQEENEYFCIDIQKINEYLTVIYIIHNPKHEYYLFIPI